MQNILSGNFPESARSLFWASISLFLTVIILLPDQADAQNWRFSAGYQIQGYETSPIAASGYDGSINTTSKGLLELELERYLLYRLYLSVHGDVLLHNQESAFLGGPVNFNQVNFGTRLGIQWSRIGVHAGIYAGNIWNMRFAGEDLRDESPVWLRPEGSSNTLTAGYAFGAKYYLNRYIRLNAELRSGFHVNNRFQSSSTDYLRANAESLDFGPLTFSAGFSVSIPFRSRGRAQRIEERDRLPLLMEVGGVSFGPPMVRETHITSGFGTRWGRPHEGVDLQASRGDDVVAAANGVVIEARVAGGYGNLVVIRHGSSYTTRYAHLHRVRVREGDTVRRGEVIGTAGDSGVATGVHLHFEIRRDGEPVDPSRYIGF